MFRESGDSEAVTRRGNDADTASLACLSDRGAGPRLLPASAIAPLALSTSAAESRSSSRASAEAPPVPRVTPPPLNPVAARRSVMAQDTPGSRTAAAGTTLVIPGEMAARVDRLPRSFMAWEICLIVQVGWAIAASTDGIAAQNVPVRLAAGQGDNPQPVRRPVRLPGRDQHRDRRLRPGLAGRQDRPAQGPDPVRGAGRGVHLAVRLRDELPGADFPVDRRHARVRRVPGHQRRVHERDHGPEGPAHGDDGLPDRSHLHARRRPDRHHPALLVPQPVQALPVAARRAEHPGRGGAVPPDAGVPALAGGQGAPG